jgi:hypothetical protein
VDYTFCGRITTGLGVINEIGVEYISGTNTMAVSINGDPAAAFHPDSGSSPYIRNRTGGRAGFITVVGSSTGENFPDTTSDVRFILTSRDNLSAARRKA